MTRKITGKTTGKITGKTTGNITGKTTGKSEESPDERCLIIRTKDGERRDKSVWRSSNVVLFGLYEGQATPTRHPANLL